jgi:hypothetical protein
MNCVRNIGVDTVDAFIQSPFSYGSSPDRSTSLFPNIRRALLLVTITERHPSSQR